jgi:hypothetical protein
MINFKNLTLEELKRDYSERRGFVFQSGVVSSNEAIERLCNTLIQHNLTKEYPEVVVQLGTTTVFVYNELDVAAVFQAGLMGMQLGMFKVETLYNALK